MHPRRVVLRLNPAGRRAFKAEAVEFELAVEEADLAGFERYFPLLFAGDPRLTDHRPPPG